MQQKNRLIFNRLICDNSKKINWYLDATNRTWEFRENWVIISRSAKVHRNFWKFPTIRFLLQGRKSTTFQTKRLLKLFLSDWDRDGRNHAYTYGETWFWRSRWFKTKNLQCVFGHQYFNTRINIKISQSIFLYNYRAFDWHVDGRNQTAWFDLIDWFVTTPKKLDWNFDATNRTWKFREN